ncbi:hypothetical protein [Shewanella khirikhana]|uniref:hypothetical protein n=1 Tax=Shewanella khirikhana TaxID=1965282 RepID=UPI000F7E75A9|nr:hypothetical protein [Shewanella khirikhana]
MEEHTKLECSFRFLSLSKREADSLKSFFKCVNFGRHFKTGEITAVIELLLETIPVIQDFIETTKVSHSNRDIFISVTSSYDSQIVDIPKFVNQAAALLDTKLVFSYTCTS